MSAAGDRALFCLTESWWRDFTCAASVEGEDTPLYLLDEKTKQYWLGRVAYFLRGNSFVYVPPDLLRIVREEHARFAALGLDEKNDPTSLVWLGVAGADHYLAKEVLRQNPEKP